MITTIDTGTVLVEVEARLVAYFDRQSARAARHSPRFVTLWAHMREAAAGGKRLRPRLVALAGLHLGHGAPIRPLVEVATAIELLHTALLLHDDVIDGDVERRGVQNLVGAHAATARRAGVPSTAADRWGQSAAILAGDLLIAAALRLTADLDLGADRRERLVDLLDESIFRAAAGELADVAFAAGLDAPSAADIRRMMADKTAHYSVELPLRAGAVLAGASRDEESRLAEIGRSLGIVFQMRDDLLGVFGAVAETGKSASNDLREGKETMLVALARGTSAWARAEHWFGREDLDEAGADLLREALERSGARDRFEAALREERDAVLERIRGAALPDALAEALATAARFAAERRA